MAKTKNRLIRRFFVFVLSYNWLLILGGKMLTVRIAVFIAVVIILFIASYYKNWWTKKPLRKFYFFLGFDFYAHQPKSETRHFYLVAGEQWAHFTVGIFVGIIFNPLLPGWLAALTVGVAKEIIDAAASKTWHKKDSIMDIAFHTLGGFCAPFMMLLFNIFA